MTDPHPFRSTFPHSANRISQLLNPPLDSTPTHDLYTFRNPNPTETEGRGAPTSADSSLRPPVPQLPSCSRAFQMFMSGGPDGCWPGPCRSGFFVPSYLKGSDYMQKLEEVHTARESEEKPLQKGGGALQASRPPPTIFNKAPVHMGMTFDLIERPPALDEGHVVPPLPSRWNKDDKHSGVELLANNLEAKCTAAPKSASEREVEACAVRADHPMPVQAGIYYFEVTILSKKRDETTICIGFASKTPSLNRPPGWEAESWAYHGDDGHVFAGQNSGKIFGPQYGSEDIIGCGVNFRTGQAFFTKNGSFIAFAFRGLEGKMLYPTIGLKKTGEHVRVNFGQRAFVFDMDGMMRQERAKMEAAIRETRFSRLVQPPLDETELIQQLVLQFLQSDGYVETARAFAEEVYAEKKALSLDPNAHVPGINIKDDQDASFRQRIRKAVLEGDIDKALKYTNTYYPHVLGENEQVYFRLRCRKFIEMVRKSTEFGNNRFGQGSNSDAVEDNSDPMDLDENDFGDSMDTEEGDDSTADQDALLDETIHYGQQLQEDFKESLVPQTSKALGDVFSLLAYPDPFQVKEVAHLLDRKGRVAVAEELNSAILRSLGKSSRSALENLYGQTSVLLDILREDGGAGAFVSLQSVIDEIPKSQPF